MIKEMDNDFELYQIDDDSSDDDIVDETVKEMHEILVKVPPFNPLRAAAEASKKRNLRPVPSIARRVNSTEANADEQLLSELRKGNGEDGEHDSSDHEASSSSEALAQAGHRTRSKSKSRGKEAQPLSLAKRVIGSKITGAGLVVNFREGKYLGLRQLVRHGTSRFRRMLS